MDWRDLGQVPVISQVLRYNGNPLGSGNCALYSVYQSVGAELMDFCDGQRRPRIGEWATYQTAFTDSWGAVKLLAEALRKEAASGQYTHLVVAMMGWRTTQEEAIRNFNSLVRTTGMAAHGEFRPLFVGITWVGPWSGRWLDPVNEAVSYPEIAELADTLGLTWLGVITEEAVLPMSDKLPVSFLTHSFGSRAAVTAVCAGPVIRRGQAAPPHSPVTGSIDRLIGFQAALSLQRFRDQRHYIYEDVRFPDHCPRARCIVVTTSKHDSAVRTIIWADLAGNYRYYRSFCRRNSGTIVSCAAVSESGAIEGEYDETMRVLYLDASKVIRYTAPGTDGSAHSDIFGAAGLLAAVAEAVAVTVLRPALEPPFDRLLKRWAVGLGLRIGAVVTVGVGVVRWPERFPVLPTALGFLVVLMPLLFGEMRLVVTKLRTTR